MARQMNQLNEEHCARQLEHSGILVCVWDGVELKRVDRSLHRDPPDALFKGVGLNGEPVLVWVEIVGAWRSKEGAKEVFSVAEGKVAPSTGRHGLIVEPDKQTACSVVDAIRKKVGKSSYENLVTKFGLGHLHVFVAQDHYPLFDEYTICEIRGLLPLAILESQSTFRSISVGCGCEVSLLWCSESQ